MTRSADHRVRTARSTAVSRLPASQLGIHLADTATVNALNLHSGGSGLIMGVNRHGYPVTVLLFRQEPTTALALGGLRFAQLIGFRALALGASVLVQTGRPAAWSSFARNSDLDWGTHPTSQHVEPAETATIDHPQLLIVDGEPSAVIEGEPRSPGPWSTVLTVREQVTGWDASTLARADLVLTQRLSASEAAIACPILNATEHEREITRLPDDMVALVTHSELHFVRIAQTEIERDLIGPVDRRSEMTHVGFVPHSAGR